MPGADENKLYLLDLLTATDQARFEARVAASPEAAAALRAALAELGPEVELAGRARALLAVSEAFAGQPTLDSRPSLRLDLRPAPRLEADPDATHPEVVRIVNTVVVRALREGVEMLEVVLEAPDVVVYVVRDGRRQEFLRGPGRLQAALVARLKIMANVDPARIDVAQHGRIALHHDRRNFDIAATFEPVEAGERVTLVITAG